MPDRDRALHATKAAALDPPGRAPSKAAPVHEAQEELRSGAEDVRGCRLNLLYDLRTVRIDVCILPYIGICMCASVWNRMGCEKRDARVWSVVCRCVALSCRRPRAPRSALLDLLFSLLTRGTGSRVSRVWTHVFRVHAASATRD